MKRRNAALTLCPVCEHDLHIAVLKCDHCNTEIKGEFSFSKFNYLNKETLYFIELFVKNRGNIKAVEKEMNISYPTVKKYLDEAVVALGYRLDEPFDDTKEFEEKEKQDIFDFKAFNLEILNKVKEGQIKVEDAIEKIRKMKEKK